MCGIAGYFQLQGRAKPDRDLIGRMINTIRHRGPDEFGVFLDNKCVLGQARLSIIDLSSGSQPMANEDNSVYITFNGEIFNYLELRPELEKLGHVFRTKCDTEVIIHAYEQWGNKCLQRFNGQFAFVIYDEKKQSLFAARDRLGIRPFFYTIHNGRFYFASEIKSLFCDPDIERRIDPLGMDEIFTWWTTAPPRTAFTGINELEAGKYLEIVDGKVSSDYYWTMNFPETFDRKRSEASWAEELKELLIDSIRLRLRADVPVGAYLSGGLDSSVTTALIKDYTNSPLETFSVAFHDKAYDESGYQQQMAAFLGTNHHTVKCNHHDIASNFPDVIWHTEKPIVRTAPAPLFQLSKLVRDNNFKVVMTGEGADEILGGYDIFKETLIRRFMARFPESKWRPLLLKRLYPTLPTSAANTGFYLEAFYKAGMMDFDKYFYSHMPRMSTTTKVKAFFSGDTKAAIAGNDAAMAFEQQLPNNFSGWHHLSKAQFVETRSLLAGYILSSQGDRVSAANSIEGRFPFLDHRLIEFAAALPPGLKIRGLTEKYLLKKTMAKMLPPEITKRVKQPYMAPDANAFVQSDSPDYIAELLNHKSINDTGIFDPPLVERLVGKCRKMSEKRISFKDNMAFVGILSTQLVVKKFIENFQSAPELPNSELKVLIDKT